MKLTYETFFIDLPTLNERQQIFYVLLNRLRPDRLAFFDLLELAQSAEGFSGAEIEQSITVGMLRAFNEEREFLQSDLLFGLNEIIPLYKIDPERMKQIQEWARSGRLRLAS